jgi:hypothetical protein
MVRLFHWEYRCRVASWSHTRTTYTDGTCLYVARELKHDNLCYRFTFSVRYNFTLTDLKARRGYQECCDFRDRLVTGLIFIGWTFPQLPCPIDLLGTRHSSGSLKHTFS